MRFQSVIKWNGSKRLQSEKIIQYFPDYINTYYEPFCGGCSVIYQLLISQPLYHTYINRIVCSDINGDLIDLWNTIKHDPKGLVKEYTKLWCDMYNLKERPDKKKFYEDVREEFNQTRSPYLYMFLNRTMKNGIPRYNKWGNFNQPLHLTRDGMTPDSLQKIVNNWSKVMKGNNVEFRRCDYNIIFDEVEDGDFLYLDPPFEFSRSTGKYFGKIDYINLFDRLRLLNEDGIRYALSFDNEHDEVIVPGDCYENKHIIKSYLGGYIPTVRNIDKSNLFENLYMNC